MGCSGTCWQDRWSSGSEFSLHTCTCTFFSFQLVFRVVGIITGYFYFIVDVCLFLYRQACRYLLIYVVLFCFMDLFLGRLIWAISLFFWRLVILVFVTCVLALCRAWSKQMSDLPFFFCYWRINCDVQSWWPKISNAWVICIGWTVNILLGRLSCHLRTAFDEAPSSGVCHNTYSDENWANETGLMNRSCGGRAHTDWLVHSLRCMSFHH